MRQRDQGAGALIAQLLSKGFNSLEQQDLLQLQNELARELMGDKFAFEERMFDRQREDPTQLAILEAMKEQNRQSRDQFDFMKEDRESARTREFGRNALAGLDLQAEEAGTKAELAQAGNLAQAGASAGEFSELLRGVEQNLPSPFFVGSSRGAGMADDAIAKLRGVIENESADPFRRGTALDSIGQLRDVVDAERHGGGLADMALGGILRPFTGGLRLQRQSESIGDLLSSPMSTEIRQALARAAGSPGTANIKAQLPFGAEKRRIQQNILRNLAGSEVLDDPAAPAPGAAPTNTPVRIQNTTPVLPGMEDILRLLGEPPSPTASPTNREVHTPLGPPAPLVPEGFNDVMDPNERVGIDPEELGRAMARRELLQLGLVA